MAREKQTDGQPGRSSGARPGLRGAAGPGAAPATVRGGRAEDSPEAGLHAAGAWAQRYLEAWNARDVDDIVGFFAEDVALVDVPLGAEAHGVVEARKLVARLLSAYSSDFRRELGRLVVDDGTSYAFEFTETGTNDLALADSRFPATGRAFELAVVSVGRRQGGRIVEHKDYWDLTAYLRQVGLMPSAAGG